MFPRPFYPLSFFFGTTADVERIVREAIEGKSPACIATVTAEMLVTARKNAQVFRALQSCTYRIADSIGIIYLFRLFFQLSPIRYTGASMVHFIVHDKTIGKKTIVVVGSDEQTIGSCNKILEKEGSVARLQHIPAGRIERTSTGWTEDAHIIQELQALQPAVVLVSLGGADNSRQEAWVAEHWHSREKSIGLMIGIGGALDMMAGTYVRAPLFLQKIGLEWLWRLLQQPSRFPRIVRAVFAFPLLAIFDTIRGKYGP